MILFDLSGVASFNRSMLELDLLSPTIGAEVRGIDLADTLDDKTVLQLTEALVEHKVLFFRDQHITQAQHIAFAARFGALEVHPFSPHREGFPEIMVLSHGEAKMPVGSIGENVWHSDVTWREIPSMASVLRAVVVPEIGGDTLWADMYAAFEGMSDRLQRYVDGMTALHDFMPSFGPFIPKDKWAEMRERFPVVEHPVVRVHPATGRKLLFVNRSFTTQIVGLPREESDALLSYLFAQAARPEYQCRFRWRKDSIAMWDNRATQHYAVKDYWPQQRTMERVTIIGDRPV
ncbi:MAG: taurine dioxygenase [Acidimicrobiia bacterium]